MLLNGHNWDFLPDKLQFFLSRFNSFEIGSLCMKYAVIRFWNQLEFDLTEWLGTGLLALVLEARLACLRNAPIPDTIACNEYC